jgi:hypothetical protein
MIGKLVALLKKKDPKATISVQKYDEGITTISIQKDPEYPRIEEKGESK